MTRRDRAVVAGVAWLVGVSWLLCVIWWPLGTAIATAWAVGTAALVKGDPEDESPERVA